MTLNFTKWLNEIKQKANQKKAFFIVGIYFKMSIKMFEKHVHQINK